MARDRKRARQRRQRQPRSPQAQSPRTSDPFVADDEPTTIPPAPEEEASGAAEEAKLAIAGAPLLDADADGDAGQVYADELEDGEYADEDLTEDDQQAATEAPAAAPSRRRSRERSRADHPPAPREKGTRFGNFLRACWTELQRVQWPNRQQVAQATGVVIGFVIIAGSYLGLADEVFSRIVNAIL
jgi:preprotein translocase SecE subunit